MRNYYTPKDVAVHNAYNDCWVSLFNKVYDLTKLLHDNHTKPECDPIVLAAGTDITHWFDPATLAVRKKFKLFVKQTFVFYLFFFLYSPKRILTRKLAQRLLCVLKAAFCMCHRLRHIQIGTPQFLRVLGGKTTFIF